ncbi:oxidoreductase [bacterium]|nr:oxidoreductase [bacterium]
MGAGKLQVALYWGSACGGCDVAVLDTNEFILDVAAAADIRFWPIAVDGKYRDLEAMADGELDLTLFNGAVRNSENEHVAKLLRRKSKLLVAFGSCSHLGGIPGLANLTSRDAILATVYHGNASLEPGSSGLPQTVTPVNGAELELPTLYHRVYRLADIVAVDYFVPGCPPAPAQVQSVLTAVVKGELPARGSVVGAGERTVCDECKRTKSTKAIKRFFRPWEIIQDPERCLLEQGILCLGSATRSGCGVRCPGSNQGCRGCYGPAPGVTDQGAKFLSAVSSTIDSKDPREIETILGGLPDFISFAYRFGLPASRLQRRHGG